ncbi:MAG: hypothetical protein ACLFNS_02135 [Desulfobacterales bacterium]
MGSFAGKYEKTTYELNGKHSSETEFVQAAEVEILGAEKFDRFVIVVTEKSRDRHFNSLYRQLRMLGAQPVIPLQIGENMTPQGQWDWFERMLDYIEPYDRITIRF